MLRWSLYDYSDAYILAKETIIDTNTGTEERQKSNSQKLRSMYWLHKLNSSCKTHWCSNGNV